MFASRALTHEARLAYQDLGVRRFLDDLRLHDVETVSALPDSALHDVIREAASPPAPIPITLPPKVPSFPPRPSPVSIPGNIPTPLPGR